MTEEAMRDLMGDAIVMDAQLAKWEKLIVQRWRELSDGERLTLMGLCCRHCGTLRLPCFCGPEWDG